MTTEPITVPYYAVIEIILSMTNVIRNSEIGYTAFPRTEEGDTAFDEWQHTILHNVELVCGHWTETNYIADTAIGWFEDTLTKVIKTKESTR